MVSIRVLCAKTRVRGSTLFSANTNRNSAEFPVCMVGAVFLSPGRPGDGSGGWWMQIDLGRRPTCAGGAHDFCFLTCIFTAIC